MKKNKKKTEINKWKGILTSEAETVKSIIGDNEVKQVSHCWVHWTGMSLSSFNHMYKYIFFCEKKIKHVKRYFYAD